MNLHEIEVNRKIAKVIFWKRHIVLRNLEKGFYPSFNDLRKDVERAVQSAGMFFPHKYRDDQFICIYANTSEKYFAFPFEVEQENNQWYCTVITLYRSGPGELRLYESLRRKYEATKNHK